MCFWKRGLVALGFLAWAGGMWRVAAASKIDRDWAKYPAVIDRPAADTLYVLGDIHGDYERMIRLLRRAGIAAAPPAEGGNMSWGGGAATLVVTGDMIDKGPRPVDVLRGLIGLQADARRSGGEVILLAGNHEAEFLAGPDAKKASDFISDLRRNGYKAADVAACRGDLGAFLCSLPFAARVGDWFFSHAGNSGGRSLTGLAGAIRGGVDREGFGSQQLTGADSLLEARLGEGNAWFNAGGSQAESERRLLSEYAEALGVKHIVEGHQHNDVKFGDGVERRTGEMFQRCGLLFLIDVGMSKGIDDSKGAVLRISGGRATAVCADGKQTLLWEESKSMDVGRAAPCTN